MKIALFKNVEPYSSEFVAQEYMEGVSRYTRVSEYVDIEFAPLAHEEIVNKQIAILEKMKKEVYVSAQDKIYEIDQRISELLALPQELKQ